MQCMDTGADVRRRICAFSLFLQSVQSPDDRRALLAQLLAWTRRSRGGFAGAAFAWAGWAAGRTVRRVVSARVSRATTAIFPTVIAAGD